MATQTFHRVVTTSPVRQRAMGIFFLLCAIAIWVFFARPITGDIISTFAMHTGFGKSPVAPMQIPAQMESHHGRQCVWFLDEAAAALLD